MERKRKESFTFITIIKIILRTVIDQLDCDIKRYVTLNGEDREPTLWKKITAFYNSPILFAIVIHRFGYNINVQLSGEKWKFIRKFIKIFYHLGRFLSVVLFKVEFSELSNIGPGLYLSNRGNIIIGLKKIGKGCTIGYNVTIGTGIGDGVPDIGDHVAIGSGSVIFGKIRVGSNTIIKPGTVLSKSVPENCEVGGNPGRILKKSIANVAKKQQKNV